MGPAALMVEAAGLGRKRLADIDLLVVIKSVADAMEVRGIRNMIDYPINRFYRDAKLCFLSPCSFEARQAGG